jgi:hypothetical protein
MAKDKNVDRTFSGLGFIDLLSITLIVVILQMTAIISRSSSEVKPIPKAFNINIYQPAERPGQSADHLGFIYINGHLILWDRNKFGNLPHLAALQRDYYTPNSPSNWKTRQHWGQDHPIKAVYSATKNKTKSIGDFASNIKEDLGVDIRISEQKGVPPRINIFFQEGAKPFKAEIGYHVCFAGGSLFTRYLNQFVHPVIAKWVVLGDGPSKGITRTPPREISRNNISEWISGGQFSISPLSEIYEQITHGTARLPGGNRCNSKTAEECASSIRQASSYVSVNILFDGSSIKITDWHGVSYNAR